MLSIVGDELSSWREFPTAEQCPDDYGKALFASRGTNCLRPPSGIQIPKIRVQATQRHSHQSHSHLDNQARRILRRIFRFLPQSCSLIVDIVFVAVLVVTINSREQTRQIVVRISIKTVS
jgi:hypothetical protein